MGITATQISLQAMDDIIPLRPKIALTKKFIFWTYKRGTNVVLRWSALDQQTGDLAGMISPEIILFPITNMLELKIIARDDIALVAAIDGGSTPKKVVASVGRAGGTFNPRRCEDRNLPDGQIVDLVCRINDDGTSDDLVCIKPVGSPTGAYGHHPPP